MSNLQTRAKALLIKIFETDYYPSTLSRVADRYGITLTTYAFDSASDEEIIDFFNAFWFALPDGPEIRRDPFFDLCDICEEVYE